MFFKGLKVGTGAWVGIVLALAVMALAPVAAFTPASADNDVSPLRFLFQGKKNPAGSDAPFSNQAVSQTGGHTIGQGGPATTESKLNDGTLSPFLTVTSPQNLQAAEARYAAIVAAGGWVAVPSGKMSKGAQSKSVAALNQRLFTEGYLRAEATQGKYADVFTSATQDAVQRFQRNHGLAETGKIDGPTLKELNIPADERLATIRANLPRVAEYSKDLGARYLVVNVPAMQIEAIENGRVYSIHNAIVGRPSRPTPVVMTQLVTIRFNPYWNAPPSIVERDIVPRMLSTKPSTVLNQMNIKVFDGIGGPEIDPDSVNWRRAVVDNYHFRQEPGGENAMASAKIEFNSPFGIYLHDTPEKQLFDTGFRFYSSGCVRVQNVAVLLNWILNGQDGIDQNRIAELAKSEERLDVTLKDAPNIRVTYLTAWPAADGTVAFRPDVYELDGSGFVLGQPLPVGEMQAGLRYILKPVPRTPAAVDADEGFSFFNFGPSASLDNGSNPTSGSGILDSLDMTARSTSRTSTEAKSLQPSKKSVASASSKSNKKLAKKSGTTAVAAKKPGAAKTDAQCKVDKDGKLPDGCKTAQAKKPVLKPVAAASATD
jgi:peptidoglycan hydrolase-like protein with peptidoglycan-binding domain